MDNKIQIIRKNELLTTEWSGGTTTQLLIYPKDSKYSERNFKWRVSSAKVEVEKSEFTHLPNIFRILMVLDGELILQHEGKEKVELKAFEQDSFMGDLKTKSFGKVTDFNLMMSEGCSGKIESIKLNPKSSINIILNNKDVKSEFITDIFYVVNGDIDLIMKNESYSISEGDLFYINRQDNEEEYIFNLNNETYKTINIIRVKIFY